MESKAGEKAGSVRIALFADTHISSLAAGQTKDYMDNLAAAVAAINIAQVDLAIAAGDLVEEPDLDNFRGFKALVRRLQAPLCVVPGNHDSGNKQSLHLTKSVSAQQVRQYEAEMGPSFYARAIAGLRVIGVNASLLGSGLLAEHQQWAFLDRELAGPGRAPTVLVVHYPPFLQTPDEDGADYFCMDPGPRQHIMSLAKQGGVRAVLSGHTHSPLRSLHGGVLYCTTLSVAFGLPRDRPVGWTLVTVPVSGPVLMEERLIES